MPRKKKYARTEEVPVRREEEERATGEGSLGFREEEENGVVHLVQYFRAVTVRRERYEVGDCVTVNTGYRLKGKKENERHLGEIIYLFMRHGDGLAEEDEGGQGMMAEVRWFVEPWELEEAGKQVKEGQFGFGEVLESDQVKDISVETFNYKVDVYFSQRAFDRAPEDDEAYWARRHYSHEDKGNITVVVDGKAKDPARKRRERALQYSIRGGPREVDPQGMREEGREREALLQAQERLSLSAAPYGDKLPCRDKDVATVKRFITLGLNKVDKKDLDRVDTGQQVTTSRYSVMFSRSAIFRILVNI